MSYSILADINLLAAADVTETGAPGAIVGMEDTSTIYGITSNALHGNASFANTAFYWLIYGPANNGGVNASPTSNGGILIYVNSIANDTFFALLRASAAAAGTAYALHYASGTVVIQADNGGTLTAVGTITLSSTPTPGQAYWILFDANGTGPCVLTASYWAGNSGVVPNPNSTPLGTGTFTDSSGSALATGSGYMGLSIPGGTSTIQRFEIIKNTAGGGSLTQILLSNRHRRCG
jgi:hypothetical protein